MENEKGQSTIEFLILIGAVFFFFIVFLYIVQINISDKAGEEKSVAIEEIGSTIQDEIILASESGEGYERSFILPNDVAGVDYNVSIGEGVVYVRTVDGKHAIVLPVFNVTGQPQKGENIIRKEEGIFLNS